jgi:hypothetical protein
VDEVLSTDSSTDDRVTGLNAAGVFSTSYPETEENSKF